MPQVQVELQAEIQHGDRNSGRTPSEYPPNKVLFYL